ncbi:MAG: histidine kinase [Paludibacteraceae bacterium]|nr:histidine kinase [Paludibacteraceae bacterium]MBR4712834.1 histidine kinase [Paludibacteraceae bacterium]
MSISDIWKRNIVETSVWIAVFSLLTFSNISYDLFLSLKLAALLTAGMFVVTLVNRVFLFPYFLMKNRMILFILLASILIASFTFIVYHFEDAVVSSHYTETVFEDNALLDIRLPSESRAFFDDEEESTEARLFLSSKWKALILLAGAMMVSVMFQYRKHTEEIEEQRTSILQEKVQLELNFLRSQINPHFLFNALNNIYSMVYTGDKNAADSVLTLSEMLRYVTYGSKEKQIPLSGEINYLENYIEFQRYSHENDIDVTFVKEISPEEIFIAPMLLQPFVENAFKYSGIGLESNAYVRFHLKANAHELIFTVENSKRVVKREQKHIKGIGIENVKKRLDLMYSGKYSLDIDETDNNYNLKLTIKLDQYGE